MSAQAMQSEIMTLASGKPASAKATDEGEHYVLANAHVVRVVYPGPRMRMQTVIQANGRSYLVRDVLIVEFQHRGDVVFASSRGLPVSGFGHSQDEALASFCEEFDFQYRNLVEVDLSSLTEGGAERGAAMRRTVASVVEFAQEMTG